MENGTNAAASTAFRLYPARHHRLQLYIVQEISAKQSMENGASRFKNLIDTTATDNRERGRRRTKRKKISWLTFDAKMESVWFVAYTFNTRICSTNRFCCCIYCFFFVRPCAVVMQRRSGGSRKRLVSFQSIDYNRSMSSNRGKNGRGNPYAERVLKPLKTDIIFFVIIEWFANFVMAHWWLSSQLCCHIRNRTTNSPIFIGNSICVLRAYISAASTLSANNHFCCFHFVQRYCRRWRELDRILLFFCSCEIYRKKVSQLFATKCFGENTGCARAYEKYQVPHHHRTRTHARTRKSCCFRVSQRMKINNKNNGMSLGDFLCVAGHSTHMYLPPQRWSHKNIRNFYDLFCVCVCVTDRDPSVMVHPSIVPALHSVGTKF